MATRLPPQRVAVTGASGLIGTALVGHLRSEGHTVQRFVRRPAIARDEITWDPKAGTVDLSALEGVDAIIHLAGAGVGDKRWTKKYKSTILNSRLLGTTAIANAVAAVKPSVFISASAIGWYGETGSRAVTENDRGDLYPSQVLHLLLHQHLHPSQVLHRHRPLHLVLLRHLLHLLTLHQQAPVVKNCPIFIALMHLMHHTHPQILLKRAGLAKVLTT